MFFAGHLVPYIKTPMFIVQSKYDYWQMDSNIYCKMFNIESSRYARQGKQKRVCEDNASCTRNDFRLAWLKAFNTLSVSVHWTNFWILLSFSFPQGVWQIF